MSTTSTALPRGPEPGWNDWLARAHLDLWLTVFVLTLGTLGLCVLYSASGHSSDMLSAVIAAAEWTDAPGKKLLSAIAVGYEMVGAAFDAFSTAPGGWDYTNLSTLGATAAIARLLRNPEGSLRVYRG